MTAARDTAEALIAALDPAAPLTFAPFLAHCAAAYSEGCCPLCARPLSRPAVVDAELAELAAAGLATVDPVGVCGRCAYMFMEPDPRDPAELTGGDRARFAASWRLALIVTEPPPEEDPWTEPCGNG